MSFVERDTNDRDTAGERDSLLTPENTPPRSGDLRRSLISGDAIPLNRLNPDGTTAFDPTTLDDESSHDNPGFSPTGPTGQASTSFTSGVVSTNELGASYDIYGDKDYVTLGLDRSIKRSTDREEFKRETRILFVDYELSKNKGKPILSSTARYYSEKLLGYEKVGRDAELLRDNLRERISDTETRSKLTLEANSEEPGGNLSLLRRFYNKLSDTIGRNKRGTKVPKDIVDNAINAGVPQSVINNAVDAVGPTNDGIPKSPNLDQDLTVTETSEELNRTLERKRGLILNALERTRLLVETGETREIRNAARDLNDFLSKEYELTKMDQASTKAVGKWSERYKWLKDNLPKSAAKGLAAAIALGVSFALFIEFYAKKAVTALFGGAKALANYAKKSSPLISAIFTFISTALKGAASVISWLAQNIWVVLLGVFAIVAAYLYSKMKR